MPAQAEARVHFIYHIAGVPFWHMRSVLRVILTHYLLAAELQHLVTAACKGISDHTYINRTWLSVSIHYTESRSLCKLTHISPHHHNRHHTATARSRFFSRATSLYTPIVQLHRRGDRAFNEPLHYLMHRSLYQLPTTTTPTSSRANTHPDGSIIALA